MSTLLATFSHPASTGNMTLARLDMATVTLADAQDYDARTDNARMDDVPTTDAPTSGSPTTDAQASADSLNQAYTEIWQGADTGSASGIEKVLGSNDLIFVVLAVSLIIWSVLLTYIIRLERNVSAIERRLGTGATQAGDTQAGATGQSNPQPRS